MSDDLKVISNIDTDLYRYVVYEYKRTEISVLINKYADADEDNSTCTLRYRNEAGHEESSTFLYYINPENFNDPDLLTKIADGYMYYNIMEKTK